MKHAVADKRLKLSTEYAQNLDRMDDAKANSMTERMLQIEDDSQSLRKKKYYPKFVQALGLLRQRLLLEPRGSNQLRLQPIAELR